MARILQKPEELNVLAFKDFRSLKSDPFVGTSFEETLKLMIKYASKNKVDLPELMNRLSNTDFSAQIVARIYGDIRRNIARLDKVIIPSILFDFIDSSIIASNMGALNPQQINIIKMLHLSVFKEWGAVIDQMVPTAVETFDKLTPTGEEIVRDMIRVVITNSVNGLKLEALPRERISSPIVVQKLNEMYVTAHNAFVNVNNIQMQFQVVLDVLKDWLNDTLKFKFIVNNPAFEALTRNFTLVKMALESDVPSMLKDMDGWFVEQSIQAVNEYLRSDDAEIRVYKMSDVASVINTYRMVNDKIKQLKSVLVIPNYRDVKFIHWFHRTVDIGKNFSRLLTYRDPTDLVESSVKKLSLSFLEDQLVSMMQDAVQYVSDLNTGFTFNSLIDSKLEDDLLLYAAIVRSNQIKLEQGSIEFHYPIDQSIVVANQFDVGTFEVGRIARTPSAVIVVAFSGKQPENHTAYPVRIQTLEKFAETHLIMTEQRDINTRSMNDEFVVKDTYYRNGEKEGRQKSVKLENFIFNGDPLTLLKVSYSPVLTEGATALMVMISEQMKAVQKIPFIRTRMLQAFWLSIKEVSSSPQFAYASSNYRRFVGAEIDPMRPDDSGRNYVMSTISLFRILYSLGTGIDAGVLTESLNQIFTGEVDVMGILTDAEIVRLAT